jgi:uncharacterized membrane protein YoaT (DUF817 family)
VTRAVANLPLEAWGRRLLAGLQRQAQRSRLGGWAFEFLMFGVKQAWACLFGGLMIFLLFASAALYPHHAVLARYDFLVLAAVAIQAAMLVFRLESLEEAKVILAFHLVGTVMEIFKTQVGAWEYPEPSLLRIGGVPLFSGFMYAAVGSYLARVMRIFHMRFEPYPPAWPTWLLAIGVYANFFLDHWRVDLRWLLLAAVAAIYWRSWAYFTPDRRMRRMPLLVGFLLCALFIWFAENIGTYSRAWIYPSQHHSWSAVSPAKIGSWLLLMIISFVLTLAVRRSERSPSGAVAQPVQ